MHTTESTQTPHRPQIKKFTETSCSGIQTRNLSRCVVGYILHGEKYVYYDDQCFKFSAGDLFFFGMGCHYTKNVPEKDHPYEQIVFYYSSEELQRILVSLNMSCGIDITDDHRCEECSELKHASMAAWSGIRNFFRYADACLREEASPYDPTLESFRMTELLYRIVSHENCCLKSMLLGNIDTARDNIRQIVHTHIFADVSIEDLARLCNRSLTSFKKDFGRIYGTSPHQWFLRQRLAHARLLLISTDRAIAEIGTTCAFPNTSHFIKLFRKQYDMTPATYRTRHRNSGGVRREELSADSSAKPDPIELETIAG